MTYQPMFDRSPKGSFEINNNFIGIQAGSEGYLLEDEFNELQWIQYEQKAQSNRSTINSGLIYNFPIINGSKSVINNSLNIIDKNTLLWSIRDYVPVNINGYTFRLCGTHKRDVKQAPTDYNNILINLTELELLDGSINELIYLEVWFENINIVNNQISIYGGESNDSIEFTKDERLDVETTRRVQLKWEIKTAQNKQNLTQVSPPNSDKKYELAKFTAGQESSIDDNLYKVYIGNKNKRHNIDGIYYAIPLFLVKRTPNDIVVGDITSIYPKAQTYLNNIKSNTIHFGKDETSNGIIFENNDGDLSIKSEDNELADVTINDLIANNVSAESISTSTVTTESVTTEQVNSKIYRVYNQKNTKFAQFATDDSNVLNITNTTGDDCSVKLGYLVSSIIDVSKLQLKNTEGQVEMAMILDNNEIKVKKNLESGLSDVGGKLYSETLASNKLDIRGTGDELCSLVVSGETVKMMKNGSNTDYANLTVGNITIKGNSTTVESETVTIADNILLLNSNVSSDIAPTENAGIEINRGNSTYSSLIWNEELDKWTAGLHGAEDIVLLKTSPEIDNPTINGLLTIQNEDIDKIKLVSPLGSECKSKIDVYQNKTLQSSIAFDASTAGRKLWTITTNGSSNKIATINSNNVICNNIGEVAYSATQYGESNTKPQPKGLNTFYVATDIKKVYFDTNVGGSNQWLDVGRPLNLPDCDSNFAYDSKPSDFSNDASKKLYYNGYFYANRVYNAVYNDYAEYFKKGNTIVEPGDVVVCGENGEYVKSSSAYSNLVVGVFSDTYGHLLGGEGKPSDEQNYIPIGLSGRVNVKVIGDIKKGDLLVSSDIPGVAQSSNKHIPGTIIGKALENHSGNNIDRISMLIMNM